MKKTIKILSAIAVPVIILGLFVYLAMDMRTLSRFDLIDGMQLANESGTLDDYEYYNKSLGVSFNTPEVEDTIWKIITYTDQFTRPPTLNKSSKAEFVAMEKGYHSPYFVLRARYMDIPYSTHRKETSMEFGQRLRDDYVRETVSRHRAEYSVRFIISDSEAVTINGYTYYRFSAHDMVENEYYSEYIIRIKGFGYRFIFYGWDAPIDQDLISSILYTVEFTKPTVKFVIT